MRITCNSINDFLRHLDQNPAAIYGQVVYVDVNRRCIDGEAKPKVRWLVGIQVSAIMGMGDEGQCLLQAAENCGLDYEDSSQEKAGTIKMKALREALEDRCVDLKLRLMPGVVSE